MSNNSWLPRGYDLSDGSKVRSLMFAGDEWQIYDTTGANNILVALTGLTTKWALDESLFEDLAVGSSKFKCLTSHEKYTLAPVDSGKSPDSTVDAIAFSLALMESRKVSPEASFHDAIYVEQYSRLLPIWSLTPSVDDEVVLGTWITGGVVISTESFRRLSALTGWMSPRDLSDIIRSAGFNVPADAPLISRHKPKFRPQAEEKTAEAPPAKQQDAEGVPENNAKPKVFTLPGRPQLEDFFNEHIIDIIFNSEKYQALGIEFPAAIVLHGPPGCGKTFAVEKLVEFIDWPSFSIDSNSVGSPYIHETSKKVSEVFDKAIDSAPSVLVIDEMESFLSDRMSGRSSGLHHVEEVAEFLRRIPEAIKSKVLIVAMTNIIDMIDPAILRRGRFDHVIEVGMPSRIEVASLIDALLIKLPKSKDLNIDKTVDALTGKPLSDSAFIIREAARLAAKTGKSMIDQESIDAALKSLPGDKEEKNNRIGFV